MARYIHESANKCKGPLLFNGWLLSNHIKIILQLYIPFQVVSDDSESLNDFNSLFHLVLQL